MRQRTLHIFLLLTAVFGMTAAASADDTDLTGYGNTVYLESAKAVSGEQYTLSVKLKNTASVCAFQFDLMLPDGFSVAKGSDGNYALNLSTARISSTDGIILKGNETDEGKFRVLCAATTPADGKFLVFSGNDGEVCTITVDVPKVSGSADYTISLGGIVLDTQSDDNSISEAKVSGDISSTLTVDASTVVLDENSTISPTASDGTVNVQVKRTLTAGEWNTLCLPFSMTGEQVTSAFGDDVLLSVYSGYEASTDKDASGNSKSLTVNFTRQQTSDGIKANTPYIIKPGKAVTEFTVENVTVDPQTAETGTEATGKMTGSYVAGCTIPATGLFISGNEFWYSTGNTSMQAYRCWISLPVVLSSYYDETATAKVSISISDSATGIRSVGTDKEKESGNVYSIDGSLVSVKGTEGLGKGVYIHNGKKIIIR